jgi:hypothetical protein
MSLPYHADYLTVSECTGSCIQTGAAESTIDDSLFNSATSYTFSTSATLEFRRCYFHTAQHIAATGTVTIGASFFLNGIPPAFEENENENVGNLPDETPNFGRTAMDPCVVPDGRTITPSQMFAASSNSEASQEFVPSSNLAASNGLEASHIQGSNNWEASKVAEASNNVEASHNVHGSNNVEGSNNFQASDGFEGSHNPGFSGVPEASRQGSGSANMAASQAPVWSDESAGSQRPPDSAAFLVGTEVFTLPHRIYQGRRRFRQGFLFIWVTTIF